MDLVTVLMHQMHHWIGLADVDAVAASGDVMSNQLPTGVRRDPLDHDPLLASVGDWSAEGQYEISASAVLTAGNASSPAIWVVSAG